MAAFQFRLAPVLRFRQRSKEEKEWELGLLFDAQRRKQEEIAKLEREQLRIESADAAGGEEIVAPADLRLYAEYLQTVARRLKIQRVEVAQLDGEIAAKREELVDALRDVKTLEQLRQRWAEKFRREQNALEQKQNDAASQRKFSRHVGRQSLP
jgi:flagellar export protein FliJ